MTQTLEHILTFDLAVRPMFTCIKNELRKRFSELSTWLFDSSKRRMHRTCFFITHDNIITIVTIIVEFGQLVSESILQFSCNNYELLVLISIG